MIVYPAIDLRGGQVVRLREGDPNRQTVFSDDPIEVASRWIDQGAQWLHIVSLDGAFDDANDNIEILRKIAKLNVKIQFGGGLRSLESMKAALETGADRVVIGTLAATNPDVVVDALSALGSAAICIAMDARDGLVTTHGWQQATNMTPVEFGRLMKEYGAEHALYTDVSRDGSMVGVNIHDTVSLARNTGLQVIASGGISKMIEIQQLAHSRVIAGVVIGMALYRDEISLIEAIIAAKE